ncbi:DUF6292 family protein [Amycolatopsis aidingensis]|uniref:DUF6292 family protein n=1 Tax=Amycolatopsis aidingensis TaxID=2842453 RepID=UPI001C0BAE53|nr:DUF6292 family protein [Amycolatopsis aidingensis]
MSDDATAASLHRGLAGYLRAVAGALAVPAEATSFEISDTVSAYLGLARRWNRRPERDLMLVWNERYGWALAVEPESGEPGTVLSYLPDEQVVPGPATVARFVTEVLDGHRTAEPSPGRRPAITRTNLAEQLARYT